MTSHKEAEWKIRTEQKYVTGFKDDYKKLKSPRICTNAEEGIRPSHEAWNVVQVNLRKMLRGKEAPDNKASI